MHVIYTIPLPMLSSDSDITYINAKSTNKNTSNAHDPCFQMDSDSVAIGRSYLSVCSRAGDVIGGPGSGKARSATRGHNKASVSVSGDGGQPGRQGAGAGTRGT
jgi:hypothetical protein